MPTHLSLSGVVALAAPLASSVSKQFASRPSLNDYCEQLLLDQWKVARPTETFDPASLWLVEPQYVSVNGQKTFNQYRLIPLIELLQAHCLRTGNVQLIEGYHFVTREAGAENPQATALDLATLQQIINEWGPLLLEGYAERLVDYWNQSRPQGGSRWQWLSDYLQTHLVLNVRRLEKAGAISAVQAATALVVAAFPEGDMRAQQSNGHQVQAGLMLLRDALGEQMTHALLIQRTLPAGQSPVVMMYSPERGLELFGSVSEAAVHLARLGGFADDVRLQQYVPLGSVFDAQAQAHLEQMLGSIEAVAQFCRDVGAGVGVLQDAVEHVTGFLDIDTHEGLAKLASARAVLPGWLVEADERSRRQYTAGLSELAKVQAHHKGKSYLDDIPDIQVFAASTLMQVITEQHPGAPLADLADVQVHILTTPNAELSIVNAGDFTLQDEQISLTQLALFNLSGRPRGRMLIEPLAGRTLPAWVSTATIEALITEADVGRRYTERVQRLLRTDRSESQRRQRLFTEQLRVQLPLQALELRIRQQQGVNESGYRMVAAFARDGSQAQVDRKLLKLSRLAFKAAADRAPDAVMAMFILGPGPQGEVMLYRPLSREPLKQYANGAALFAAIKDDPALRREVLDWMTPAARDIYANGGFEEPHITRFGQGSDFAPISAPAPAIYAPVGVSGDVWEQIYQQAVDALLTSADRQSLTDEESRWVSYEQLAWVLFNGLLPVLPLLPLRLLWATAPLSTSGWILQSLKGLDAGLRATTAGDADAQAAAMADMLFNLALALLTTAVHIFEARPSLQLSRPGPVQPPPATAQPVGVPVEVPSAPIPSNSHLDFSWSNPRGRLTTRELNALKQFRLAQPPQVGLAVPHGRLRGLYTAQNKWYAEVEGQWFRVEPGNDTAQVISDLPLQARGPWLRRDEALRWRPDLRMRLAGGSPLAHLEQQRADRARQLAPVQTQLTSLITGYQKQAPRLKIMVDVLVAATEQKSARVGELRQQYLDTAQPCQEALIQAVALCDQVAALDPASGIIENKADLLSALCRITRNLVTFARQALLAKDDLLAEFEALVKAGPLNDSDDRRFYEYLEYHVQTSTKEFHWVEQVEGWLAELQNIPYHSVKPLAELRPLWSKESPSLAWGAMLINGLGTLAARKLLAMHQDVGPLDAIVQAVRVVADSQVHLLRSQNISRLDRIEVLESALTQYEQALDGLAYEASAAPEFAKVTETGRLRDLIEHLRSLAEDALAGLAREQYNAGRSKRKKKRHKSIINTRRRGLLVGEVRSHLKGSAEIMEVRDPIRDQAVASFVLDKTAGDWVALAPSAPSAPAPTGKRSAKALNQAVQDGQNLLDGADALTLNAWKQARTAQRPSELQDILEHHGERLVAAAQAIEQVLTVSNEVDLPTSRRESAAQRMTELRNKAVELVEEGRLLRIHALKRQPPTAARVRYLSQQGEIMVQREGDRRTLGAGSAKDYLDEYSIKDKAGKVLWYAHFHYPALGTAAADYSRAHLKTVEQRLHGYRKQLADSMAGKEVVAILRSQIEPPLDKIFLQAGVASRSV